MESKKNVVMFIIIVVCLALAAAIAVINFGGGGDTRTMTQESRVMLCVNPDCGHVFEMTVEERREVMKARGRMIRRGGPPAFTCPKCGEESAYQARKCPKCNTVFIPDYTTGDFTDRCPECGYSAIEERRQQEGQ